MSDPVPSLGRIALGVHFAAAAVVLLIPALLFAQDYLPGGVAFSLAALGAAIVGLQLFNLASTRRRLYVLERQQPALARQTVSIVKTELQRVERRLSRGVRDATFDPYRYWEDRAARMGASAVGDVNWSGDDWDDETKYDVEQIVPFFAARIPQPCLRVLDFGCGVGRFTSVLAELAEEGAVGADATESLLAIAEDNKTSDKASFQQVRGQLPFPDDHFDAIWVAYVMIHVIGEAKQKLARELLRVTKPGGLVFLMEGVNTWRTGSPHCDFVSLERYRQVFGLEFEAFRRTDLAPLSDERLTALLGEAEAKDEDLHLVMVARKSAASAPTG